MAPRLRKTKWMQRLSLAVLLTNACCGPQTQPQPVVVRRTLPPLLPDRRDEVVARWNEIAYIGTQVVVPRDLWRLASEVSASGWSNAKALKAVGSWEGQ